MGKGVCRYAYFVCEWSGKFPVCHAWDCDVTGRARMTGVSKYGYGQTQEGG